jgi:hypothetical protein
MCDGLEMHPLILALRLAWCYSYVSDNIQKALARMKGPPLQPQQLYYLDCINIYPVVQWLVKKVIEVRSQTADVLRLFSESQFKKHYDSLPNDTIPTGEKFVDTSRSHYLATRKYRSKADGSSTLASSPSPASVSSLRRGGLTLASRRANKMSSGGKDDSHVHSVLVEYGSGHLYTMALLQKAGNQEQSDKDKELQAKRRSVAAALGGAAAAAAAEEAVAAQREAAIAAQKREQTLLRDQMQELRSQNDSDMTDVLNARLKRMQQQQQQSDADAAADYEKAREENAAFQDENQVKLHGVHNHKRYLAQVEKLTRLQQEKLDAILPKFHALREQVESLQSTYDQALQRNEAIQTEMDRLLALETDETRDDINALRALVALNENLNAHVAQFKQTCKEQMAMWQEKIEDASDPNKQLPDERLDTIAQAYDKDVQKLKSIQSHLSSKVRAIALVRRKMDEIPSRRELQQYQKHFLELYEQMAVKFTETRVYYNTFNSLQDRREFLQREVNILNSVQETYPTTSKNKTARTRFVESLTQIADQVLASLDKSRAKFKEEKDKRNQLDDQHTTLVEGERRYFKAAKDFQEECRKTELLQAKISMVLSPSDAEAIDN